VGTEGQNPLRELVAPHSPLVTAFSSLVTGLGALVTRHSSLVTALFTALFLAAGLLLPLGSGAVAHFPRKGKLPPDLSQILSRMNEAAKRLKSLSANLEYTKVTVLVNDKSREEGRLFFRQGKPPEIRIEMQQPESKVILFKKNKAEIYLPKINQLQEFNLEQKSGLVEEFLLLGFGSETGELSLKKSYRLKYLKEEELDGDTTAVLELTPRKESVAAQLEKIQMWVSEESWLPAQQQFFEPGGDYLIARYKAVKVNLRIPSSTFEIHPAEGAKRVKMN
jgi:outer membrane lipoprotein-sorting protein